MKLLKYFLLLSLITSTTFAMYDGERYISGSSGWTVDDEARLKGHATAYLACNKFIEHLLITNSDLNKSYKELYDLSPVSFLDISSSDDRRELLKKVLKAGGLIQKTQNGYNSLFNTAAYCPEHLKMILPYCSLEQINERYGFDQATPLHGAIMHGQPDSVRLLLDAGADITTAYYDLNPLQLAMAQFTTSYSSKGRIDFLQIMQQLYLADFSFKNIELSKKYFHHHDPKVQQRMPGLYRKLLGQMNLVVNLQKVFYQELCELKEDDSLFFSQLPAEMLHSLSKERAALLLTDEQFIKSLEK